MGRLFEVRKSTMFARYDRMAKQFSRVGKDIAIAVKAGGPDPDNNPSLRRALQNAKGVNMPKDKVDSAIKRAMGKDTSDYELITYEGYAPHGVAIMIETATDNPVRTVAKVRAVFNKYNGSLGTSGSVSFQFKRMGVFKLLPEGIDPESLELELIDFGLEEMGEGKGEDDEDLIIIRVPFEEFGTMQKGLEDKNIEVKSTELEWIPINFIEVDPAVEEEILTLIAKMEEEDDVQTVSNNMQ